MITRNIIIKDILIPSIKQLYEVDFDNIRFGVSERNICARLAHHMENIMRQYDELQDTRDFHHYYADVEYNRMGNGQLKMYENSAKLPSYMVSDLLIQSRGYEQNYLAVEMKRKGNKRHVREDKERLASMVSSDSLNISRRCVHDTLVGAFIVYSQNEVNIQLFENVNGSGQMTDSISLRLDDNKWTERWNDCL